MKKTFVITVLALILVLAFATTALAATPADGGGGLDFGTMHATMGQAVMIDGEMNPGMHEGITGWPMTMPAM